MIFSYLARSALIAGHVAGNEYAVKVLATECVPEIKIEKEQVRSISGVPQSTVKHRWREWSVKTVPIREADRAKIVEFLASVMDGSTFTFDETATTIGANGEAVPVNPRECELLDQQVRAVPASQGRNLYTISFAFRELGEPDIGVSY